MSYFLYVIGPKDGPLKIGISKNVPRRRGTLNIGNHQYLHVHHQVTFSTKEEAEDAERNLHYFYQDDHLRGEWFDLSPKDLSRIKEKIDLATNSTFGWVDKSWKVTRKSCDKFTPSVFKKTRLALELSYKDIADDQSINISENVIKNFENGSNPLGYERIESLVEFFSKLGVEFVSQGDDIEYRVIL
ncbi:TPA: GIY-YIG nuclease family protein [Vibrio parahaemolyticus]|uniref:GIY-YIG nuclease family protein n=1 Tax=Vibrio parahaemolyticus TaxID=670 RepID=UPI001122B302|nr:GIY-YIG nuclease family protein [Vibrio parahaemolyticus]EHY0932062.1 GIY-YIG nuclease family protein [Vibrio parahaemolyticus]EJC6831965.1 GIY-YIG nuclease family protein [Vibrio parahaemolyticus]ELA9595940.1 GIY-YIG nuclease family protein [Vibrio parahaemolyticus]MDF4381665.1 GIY-YIG nuclease family protein [Vibrio parahaemolyticus]MDF4390932.1 GIY-YIG nuclease family protein [Vibrio parahaemolyticus]